MARSCPYLTSVAFHGPGDVAICHNRVRSIVHQQAIPGAVPDLSRPTGSFDRSETNVPPGTPRLHH